MTATEPISYSELIRVYGKAVFQRACALAKVSPIGVEDACKRIKRANEAAKSPFTWRKAL